MKNWGLVLMWYAPLISRWNNRMFKLLVMLVFDRGGPIAEGLEQTSALRVLDTQNLRERVVALR